MTLMATNSAITEARLIPAAEFAAMQNLPLDYVIELAKRYQGVSDYSTSQSRWYIYDDALGYIKSIKRRPLAPSLNSLPALESPHLQQPANESTSEGDCDDAIAVDEHKPYLATPKEDLHPSKTDKRSVSDQGSDAELAAALLNFSDSCNAANAVTPLGLKSLKYFKNKNSMRFVLRRKQFKDLEILKTRKGEKLTEDDCRNVLRMYNQYQLRAKEGLPVTSVKDLAVRECIQVTTFNDMYRYGLEVLSKSSVGKLNRLWPRYFSGLRGDSELRAYTSDEFKALIESRPEGHQKSDRDELKKLFSSIYNKADKDPNVEQLAFSNLADGIAVNREINNFEAPPELSTYASILLKLCQQNELSAAMHLLLQESVGTRKGLTSALEWRHVEFDDFFINVRCQETKNGKYTRHVFAPQIAPLIDVYRDWALKNRKPGRKGAMHYLFESPKLVNQPVSNFDSKFDNARQALCQEFVESDLPNMDKDVACKQIRRLTQHKLRKMNKKLLLELNATFGQIERDAGRTPDENKTVAYDDLTDETLVELNRRKHEHMMQNCQEYRQAIEMLFDKLSEGV